MDRGANGRAILTDAASGVPGGPMRSARSRARAAGWSIASLIVAGAVLAGVAAPTFRSAERAPALARSDVGPPAPFALGARQSTPGTGTAVAQPGPEECRVAPRTVEELRRLNIDAVRALETAVAEGLEGAAAELAPFNLYTPVPEPTAAAGAAAVAGVNATLREMAACGVAGDQLRTLALLTDAYFVRTLTFTGPWDEAFLTRLASPEPTPAEEREPFAPVAAADVRLLPDGRVAVLVPAPETRPGGSPPPTDRMLYLFARVGDRYLLDDQWFVLPEGATSPATPAARATSPLPRPVPGDGSTAAAGTTLIVLEEVPLREAAAADAAVAGTLAAGQAVEATGSSEEADGETWVRVGDPANGASGFVPARLLRIALNEIRVTSTSTMRRGGTEVPITPNAGPTPTLIALSRVASPAAAGAPAAATPAGTGQALREAIAARLTAWRARSDVVAGGTSSSSFAVDADRLLAGDPAETEQLGFFLGFLEGRDSKRCRVAVAVVAAGGVDEGDGAALAERVAGAVRDRFAALLGDAPVETVGVAGGGRSEVVATVVFEAGCPSSAPASVAAATPIP